MSGGQGWWNVVPGAVVAVSMFGTSVPVVAGTGAPIKVETVASAADLTAEAQAIAGNLASLLGEEADYKETGAKVKQAASLLAILAQGIAEHPDESPLKAAAPDLRNAAMVVAKAGDHAAVKAGLPAVAAAAKGEASGKAEIAFDWAKLSKMHPAMEEMNARGTVIRRLLKRPKDPAADSRHAMAIAMLAIATYADTHEVKKEADLPEWRELSVSLQTHMTQAAAAMKAKETAKAGQLFTAGMETCNKCHEKFQE